MKTFKNILIVFAAGLLATSCTQILSGPNLEDNPNTVGTASTLALINQAEIVSAYLAESDAARYGGINANYITGIDAQWIGYEQYTYAPDDFDALWSNLYSEGITHARIAKGQATEEGDVDGLGYASLLEAYQLGELASSFGDVPDSEAVGESDAPTYDSQAMVFNHVQELLSEVVANASTANQYISDPSGGTISTSNLGQVAHSLKARYFLNAKNYPMALSEANAGISSPTGGWNTVHADATGAQNLFWNFAVLSRPDNTTPLNSYLEDLVDPSGPVARQLATPGEAARYAFYYDADGDYNLAEDGIFAVDASLPLISWHETRLIAAEAAFRTSGDGAARSALNAVRTQLGTEYGGGFPASTASGNALLTHILEEKYITIYPSSSTFHDLSRTNNALGVRVKTGNQLPQRFLYPQIESDTNPNAPANFPGLFTPTPVNQ
jgi:hypothetical protein